MNRLVSSVAALALASLSFVGLGGCAVSGPDGGEDESFASTEDAITAEPGFQDRMKLATFKAPGDRRIAVRLKIARVALADLPANVRPTGDIEGVAFVTDTTFCTLYARDATKAQVNCAFVLDEKGRAAPLSLTDGGQTMQIASSLTGDGAQIARQYTPPEILSQTLNPFDVGDDTLETTSQTGFLRHVATGASASRLYARLAAAIKPIPVAPPAGVVSRTTVTGRHVRCREDKLVSGAVVRSCTFGIGDAGLTTY